jgi:hypothetical protein
MHVEVVEVHAAPVPMHNAPPAEVTQTVLSVVNAAHEDWTL